jgi:alkanesulfonate monooxygenase
MEVFGFLPTQGDGRYLGTSIGARSIDLAYLGQIARAADDLRFAGVLLPTRRSCEDAWAVALAIVPLTRRLTFLVAIRPRHHVAHGGGAFGCDDRSPVLEGRSLINVVTGGDPRRPRATAGSYRTTYGMWRHTRFSSCGARYSSRRRWTTRGRG